MSNLKNIKISGNRLSIFVFNILILILSAIVTTLYATQPIWIIKADVKLEKEQLMTFIDPEEYPNADFDFAYKDGFSFKTRLEVPVELLWTTNKEMLKSLVKETSLNPDINEIVKEFIDSQIEVVIDDMMPVLKSVVVKTAKSVAVSKTQESIIESLTSSSGETDIAQQLDEAGYTTEWFDEQMNTLTDALHVGDITATDATDIVIDTLSDIIAALQASDNETISSINSINEPELRETIMTGLVQFENDDGIINVDDAIADLLLNGLSTYIPDELSSDDPSPASTQVETQEDSEKIKQLKESATAKVYEILPADAINTVAIFFKVSAAVLLFCIFTWVYVALKILFKFFYRDNSVKLKLPLWFGHVPGLLFWIAPTIAFMFVKNSLTWNMLSLHFGSSGIAAVIAAFALFVISIPYCSMRQILKPRKLTF